MKKILVDDDEKDIRFILSEIFTDKNNSVSTIGSIKAAEKFI